MYSIDRAAFSIQKILHLVLVGQACLEKTDI
jgi:hypothetical protein